MGWDNPQVTNSSLTFKRRRELLPHDLCDSTSQHCLDLDLPGTLPPGPVVQGPGGIGGGGGPGPGLGPGGIGGGGGPGPAAVKAQAGYGALAETSGGYRTVFVAANEPSASATIRDVGGVFDGHALSQPVAAQDLQTLDTAVQASVQAPGLELVSAALERRRAIRRAAADDSAALGAAYARVPAAELVDRMLRASSALQGDVSALEGASTGLTPGARLWFRNLYQDAADKAREAAAAAGGIAQASAAMEGSPFASLLMGAAPASGSDRLADAMSHVFSGGVPLAPNGNEALTLRMVELAGLPADQAAAVGAGLKLKEDVTLGMEHGGPRKLTLLHNGYILGDSKTGYDCSSFISSLLSRDTQRMRLTSLDFRNIYIYRSFGRFPVHPTYPEQRLKEIKQVSSAFLPVNLYAGAQPLPGDILVHRFPWKNIGHVFLISDYNPVTRLAMIEEAAQSAGTIREREFPLTLDDPGTRPQRVRPGLLDLRLASSDNSQCRYTKNGGSGAGK